MKLSVNFGALADPISKQLPQLDATKAEMFQADADAISRLRIRGLIAWSAGDRAYEKLWKLMKKELRP